jgi:hypothetical protein
MPPAATTGRASSRTEIRVNIRDPRPSTSASVPHGAPSPRHRRREQSAILCPMDDVRPNSRPLRFAPGEAQHRGCSMRSRNARSRSARLPPRTDSVRVNFVAVRHFLKSNHRFLRIAQSVPRSQAMPDWESITRWYRRYLGVGMRVVYPEKEDGYECDTPGPDSSTNTKVSIDT